MHFHYQPPSLVVENPPESPETVHGCGWFDSSYELRRGLQVSEETDETMATLWVLAAMTLH